MSSSNEKSPRICLVTGPPGCGKTTLVREAIEPLSGVRVAGFLTEEIREQGRRQGFSARMWGGDSCIMAHRNIKFRDRVGAYGVDVAEFDRVIVDPLASMTDVEMYVIDEIGKMELHSRRFLNLVNQIVEGSTPLLATVPVAPLLLVVRMRRRADARLIDMGRMTRVEAGDALGKWLGGVV